MTIDTTSFYSKLKDEDAYPYASKNLLAVADGLGGAGSFVHALKEEDKANVLTKIKETFFCGFQTANDERQRYYGTVVKSLLDGGGYTSATWASRIVITRAVEALSDDKLFMTADLSKDETRRDIVSFIRSGLDLTSQKFGFEKCKYGGQLMLPTTLSVIKYKQAKKGVIVEALWAGDSRCYVLTKNGLRLLSRDDEDSSGAITNLFFADNGKTVLNYKKYRLSGPCVLMCVSDGFFDPFEPYDNLGAEYTLLEAINESNNIEEMKKRLLDFYGGVGADDVTLSMALIGFEDFLALKKFCAARIKSIVSLWKALCNNVISIQAANEVCNPDEYVRTRTKFKIAKIVDKLVALKSENKDEILLSKEFNDMFEECQKKAFSKAYDEKINKIFTDIKHDPSYLLGAISESARMNVKRKNTFSSMIILAQYLIECGIELESLKKSVDEKKQILINSISDYLENVKKEIDTIYDDVLGGDNEKKDNRTANGDIEDGGFFCEKNVLEKSSKLYASQIKNYKGLANKVALRLKKNPRECRKLFNEKFLVDTGLRNYIDDGKIVNDTTAVFCVNEMLERQDDLVDVIVEWLKNNYDKTTVIDEFYNDGKLKLFRAYYKNKFAPDKEIVAVINKLKVVNGNYYVLL